MTAEQFSMFESESSAQKPAGGSSITINKTINGKQQSVFDHWLIPVFVGEWMFGPRVQAEEIISLENTVRRNGEFDYRVKRQGKEVSHSGTYLELAIPNTLVFSWNESSMPDVTSQVSVQFSEAGDKTKLKLTVKLPAELDAQRDAIKDTWTARCKALAEKFK